MARYKTPLFVALLLGGIVIAASGQAPAKPRGVFATLTPGMAVSLTDVGGGYEIGTLSVGPELPLGYKVLEVGADSIVLEDITGVRQFRIPIYSVKSVVTTTIKPAR